MEASALKRGWIYVKTENVLWASGHENCPGAVSVCVVSTSKCFVTPTSWPSWHKGNDPIDPSREAFVFLNPRPLWTKCKTLYGQNLFMPAPQVRRDEFNRKERWRHSSNSLLSFLLSLHSHWVTNRQALLMILHLLKYQSNVSVSSLLDGFMYLTTLKHQECILLPNKTLVKLSATVAFPRRNPGAPTGPILEILDHIVNCIWRALCEPCWDVLGGS